jgi:Tripartite tricarboxylate transporter TctB family
VDEDKPSPFADLVTGAVWLAVAIAILVGAWRMDRLEHLATTIYTMPGLVPGLLGAAIGLMAVILMVRALRAGALGGARWPEIQLAEHWRLIAALALSIGFAVALVGRGLPFWLGAAIYTAAMVFVFQFPERRHTGTVGRGAVFAVVYGVASGLIIHFAFQDLFLVRLP